MLLYIIKRRKVITHPVYFNADNIFSHPFIQNLKHKPNMVQDLSRKIKAALKKQILENSNGQLIQYYNASLPRMVKRNTMDVCITTSLDK